MTLTDKARAGLASITIRGGRITKWKGQAASYSPQLGTIAGGISSGAMATALVLAGSALMPGAALAGECNETTPGSGVWVCSGAADPANDVTQVLTAPAGSPVVVTTEPGFGLTRTYDNRGDALSVTTVAGNTGISITDTNNSALRGDRGVAITALHNGSGALTVDWSGGVVGIADAAIDARNVTGSALTINSTYAFSVNTAIYANNAGSGALTITSGSSIGQAFRGIEATNAGTDLTIISSYARGDEEGILAQNNGSGALTIDAKEANSRISSGISATNSSSGTSLIVGAQDTNGLKSGIRAVNNGDGGLTITSSGLARGREEQGILALNSANGTSLTITAYNSTGELYGIEAINEGTGALSVTSSGLARATSTTIDPLLPNGPTGIFAQNAATGTDLSIVSNNATGHRDGIRAINNGTGMLSITSAMDEDGNRIGTARGTTGDGIFAENAARGTGISIAVNDAIGGTVNPDGTITGGRAGIFAINRSAGDQGLAITANNSAGGQDGIYARNEGAGALTISTAGQIEGQARSGINAGNYRIRTVGTNDYFVSTGTSINITAEQTVEGNERGIFANNFGTGSITIDAGEAVIGTTDAGIRAFNSAYGVGISITAGDTSGGRHGIFAYNAGSGGLTVSSSGTATGTQSSGVYVRQAAFRAPYAYGLRQAGAAASAMSTSASDVVVDVENATGGQYGIRAINEGTGLLSVTSTGLAQATSTTFDPAQPNGLSGIFAQNAASGTDLTIVSNNTVGHRYGIRAINNGTGVLSISSVEDEEGNRIGTARGTTDDAIFAENTASGIGITIDVNDAVSGTVNPDSTVTGGRAGIYATNRGTAAVPEGSTATNGLTISVNNATGGQYGIRARNEGTGALSITATGTVTGATGQGIVAVIDGPGTDLVINARDVTGGTQGIEAANGGTGNITIDVEGTARGNGGFGISATAAFGDITINAAAASGSNTGIFASSGPRSGPTVITDSVISISATGPVTGGQNGIYAFTTGSGGIEITAGDVTSSGLSGIFGQNVGTGAMTITSSGTVNGGTAGINAQHGRYLAPGFASDLTIDAVNTSGTIGILARHYGSGALSVTSRGNAIGETFGIRSTDRTFEGPGRGTDVTIVSQNASARFGTGISVLATGQGNVSVTSNGRAQGGAFGDGITVSSGVRNTQLTIDSNDASGGYSGIRATHTGSGMTTITSRGTALGATRDGIYAANAANGIGMTITVNDAIAGVEQPDGSFTGGIAGINAINRGTAMVPEGSGATNGLTITANNTTGGQFGIRAFNEGTGALNITSTGTATGAATTINSVGIRALHYGAGDASITAEDTFGNFGGISATNFGAGTLTITSNGTATATGSGGGNGVYAAARTGDIAITANHTQGRNQGIFVRSFGRNVTITSNGAAVATAGDGIRLEHSGTGDVVISANNVTGGLGGIFVHSTGSGTLTISSNGTVRGTTDYGIFADTAISGIGMTIAAGNAYAGTQNPDGSFTGGIAGINAINRGTAMVPEGSGATNGLSISVNNATGGQYGIRARNEGTGALTITTSGQIEGRARSGINAGNYRIRTVGTNNYFVSTGTSINITTEQTVVGNERGIFANNFGTGSITIDAGEAVIGTTDAGIRAFNSAYGVGISITAGDTSGGRHGIFAYNAGNGGLTVSSSGTATGTQYSGVYVRQAAFRAPYPYGLRQAAASAMSTSSSDVVVDVENATGGQYGIRAINEGTGALTITSTGGITATGTVVDPNLPNSLTGIYAFGGASGTGIVMDVNDVSGGAFGIRAVNEGTGGITISANGLVEVTQPFNPDRARSGNGIDARNTGGGDITITAGDVDAALTGILASNSGGNIVINATGSVSGGISNGIYAFGGPQQNGSITINAINTSSRGSAISAVNSGYGDVTINSTGTSSSADTNGIFAQARGNITITAAETSGAIGGIRVFNQGLGATLINSAGTAMATGPIARGIFVRSEASTTSVTITSNNAIGDLYGIEARQYGTGALTITSTGLAEATGTTIDPAFPDRLSGIFALNAASGTDLTVTANDTSGAAFGIRAINNGTGMLSITSVEDDDGNRIGTARSTTGDAIFAENAGSGIGISIAVNDAIAGTENPDGSFTAGGAGINAINRARAEVPEGSTATNGLTISANNTIGAEFGIRARHYGTGALTITSAGTATATELRGLFTTAAISAETGSDSSGLVIESFNASGAQVGISARHSGSGVLSVTSTGLASGAASRGIFAVAAAGSAADVVVTSQDAYGRLDGIFASQGGSGSLTVNSKGTARGSATLSSSRGISVSGLLEATDITVNAVSAFGRNNGISVRHYGTGSITVTATGDVTGSAAIVAAGGGRNVQVDAVNTSGVYAGIAASNRGNGSTEIVSRGIASASGEYGDAIRVTNVAGSTSMSVTSNIATGGLNGITATNSGTGALTITSQGAATGTNGSGITATNGGAGTDLTINAGDTTGGNYGIRAINDGSGALTITSTGSARGTALDGIYAVNAAAASAEAGVSNDTTVIAVNSTGGRTGIRALHDGAGALSVTSTGLAEGTGSGADGIYARGRDGSSGVTIASNNASGDRFGILARNGGGGVLTVTSTGLAEGGTDDGINAATLPGGGATDIVVSAHDTSGGRSGLRVIQNGTGVVRVDSKGHANGTRFRGIDVGSGVNSSGVIVNAASATGGINGIFVGHYGTGTVTVTATGDITGFNALVAANAGDNTRVTAVNTIGSNVGISADARGNGVVEVVSTGTASASDARGRAIELSNRAGGTAMSLASNNAVGGLTGIRARNAGVGAITILSSGNAVGEAEDGILAINEASATNITISANSTSGGITGINAQNNGTGALAITTSGATSGTAQTGIDALNRGTSLAITTGGAVTGGVDGIRARNYGTGGLTIIANGDVTGGTGAAINAFNSANDVTASMLVEQAAGTSFTGATDGIIADNAGGSLTVNALGTLVGTTGSGVNAVNQATATGMTLRVNNASGAVSGIAANNQGTGLGSITLTGTAQGGSGAGIDTVSAAGNLTTITLAAGARALAGASGVAIANNAGNANLSVASGASVVGEVRMGGGSDTATLAGAGALAGITVLDGGDDIDALTLNGVVATLAADRIINWENVAIAAGSDVAITGLATGALSVTDSTAVLTDLVSGTVTSSNAQLTLNGTTTLAGVLTCGGTLTVAGASAIGSGGLLGCAAADTITVSGDARVAGNIEGAGGADVIAVLGNASVTGAILGGGAGADNSGAADGSDTITIDTTGSVARIDSGLGDDVIALRGGTVAGDALGGGGNDAVTLSGARIAGAIDAGAGADVITLSAGSAAAVLGNDGNDAITLAGATITGALDGGAGDDVIALDAGSAGSVLGGEGDDRVRWNAAAATTTTIQLGAGADTLDINSAAVSLAGVTLDGGEGADTLNLNANWTGDLVGARTTNWDVININGGTIRISDSALTAGLVNVNESGRLNASNNLALTGNLAIAAGGRLLAGTAAGNNAAGVSGNLANGGLIDLRGPGGQTAVGDRLTIGGNLTGLAGSSIRLDAVLGASQTSDLIVVRGNLSGSGEVIVNNVGGIGALTTGDGIRLVQVDGTSAAGALTLAGGTIDVGAFRYALQNGGLADPGDSDWYLRSRVRDIVVPTISIARLAQDMSLAALGTLNQRTGEQQHLTLQSGDSGFLKGMWGRALGKDYSETVQSVGLGDVSTEGRLGGLQAGVDLYRAVAASGSRTSIGVFGGHLWSSTSDVSFSGFARSAGTTNSDGWILGGYVTHVAASGWYVDAVVQRDWLDHRANAADGTAAATQSRSMLASLEVGKAFGKVWKFEPQAQLIYGDTRIDAFADSRGIANRITVEDNVIGRGGFRLKRTWDHDENSDGGLFTVYAKANIWGRLDGGAGALSVGASVPGALLMREVWGDGGFGTTFSVARNAEFFSEFDVEYGIDQGGTALAGRGGFRLRF